MAFNNNNNLHHQDRILGEVTLVAPQQPRKRSVFLESANGYFESDIRKVTPVLFSDNPTEPFEASKEKNGVIFDTIKPIYTILKVVGIFPISNVNRGIFRVTAQMMAYSVIVFLLIVSLIGYIKWYGIKLVKSTEGRFEEAVIDYLFTVYLIPIVVNPVIWYESKKMAQVVSGWVYFERMYTRVTKKKLSLFLGNKPLFISIILPVLSCGIMVVTHVTMSHFRFLQVVPYCYVNTVTYLIGGCWFIQCDVIASISTLIAEDFQLALKHIGPSSQVADYRSLWMLLSKLIRDIGNASGYTVTFLCLYLFLVVTLTIYGLLSQIQEGLGVKDIGLTVTAGFAIAFLFFICDEAHYASNCVKVQFQKKLLLVELTWMNEDAQQEINMFLRATEMSPTDMSLGGFFDVNRNLFKSLLATMVTYLVVLLQFQISIPGDGNADNSLNSTLVLSTTMHPIANV